MITGELWYKVDSIWDTIWTGGITSPITVLEQITYLMFMKLLDDNQLNSNVDGSPEENLSSVKRAVDAFVGDAEQFDDLTMMCLEYKGT